MSSPPEFQDLSPLGFLSPAQQGDFHFSMAPSVHFGTFRSQE
jgi:hypothetical protein